MSNCDTCCGWLPDQQTFWLGCACGRRAHVPCLAAAAQSHYDKTGDPQGWTACLKCGKLIDNAPLVELLMKLWAKSIRNDKEKLCFYGEAATVFERRKMFTDAARAASNQVAMYVKHGYTLASSRPMLDAKRRFGRLAYKANCPEPAVYAFYDILQNAGVNGAWLGGEDLALVFMLMQQYEKAYLALHKSLHYKSIMGEHLTAKFELALCEVCLRTFRFCEAKTLSRSADPAVWSSHSKIAGDVAAKFATAAERAIPIFENLIVNSPQKRKTPAPVRRASKSKRPKIKA